MTRRAKRAFLSDRKGKAMLILGLVLVALVVSLRLMFFGDGPDKSLQRNLDKVVAQNGGERVVLTPANYKKYRDLLSDEAVAEANCDIGLETNLPANETELFTDESAEISVQFPYNSAWGGRAFRAPSFDVADPNSGAYVTFGSMYLGYSDCNFFRKYSLSIVPPENITALKKSLIEEYDWDPVADYNELVKLPQLRTSKGLKMASYTLGGNCEHHYVVVFGTKNNYVFSHPCEANVSEQDLLDIASTLRFL